MSRVAPISQQIWDMKYRFKTRDGEAVDKSVEDSWRRVAQALAAVEKTPEAWEEKFYQALEDYRFLPAGRILAGAGTGRQVTLFNCFVMGDVVDSLEGIFDSLKEAALTMQQGGGIGYDFSTLRPKGALVKGVGADASGPLSFMDVWDSMCRTIMSAGYRRGAMMATLRCDHPDIEAFIEAKQEPGRLRMFNLSVLVTDAFMQAVKEDAAWELVFDGACCKSLPARQLWEKIMRATYSYAEPGVIFIDRINRLNNLYYCEEIHATNPCGEQPLPPYGACLLGSINLAKLVTAPFQTEAGLDVAELESLVAVALRMLDNVIDVSQFPLPEQEHEAKSKRRIGLGITGLADALAMCRVRYGSEEAVRLTKSWMKAIRRSAYLASSDLAAEKGSFPLFDAEKLLAGENISALEDDVQAAIAEKGLRNALLTSIAPTGTISLYADNVSSGIEPVFCQTYTRNVLMPDGVRKTEDVSGYAFRLFRLLHGETVPLPDYFTDAQALAPADHLTMQAAVQKYVDSSISKTINCPEDISFEAFRDIYMHSYDLGCKGCTTYRPNDVTGAVLEVKKDETAANQPELPFEAAEPRARDEFEAGGVVYITQPLERPEELPGSTYKLKWPDSEHAIYITLNDIIKDGRRRPFEIFMNSKNVDNYAWTVGLTRMISAVFRRGGDVSFVVEELKAVFDPRGGQWMGRKYVPSLLAAIGDVIEYHMKQIGFLATDDEIGENRKEHAGSVGGDFDETAHQKVVGLPEMGLRQCPKCGEAGLIRQEGCDVCTSCTYSKCG
ncbi:MAG: adenosylcobalamin-dependent ribonucleoside-diphosphate reductase [Rhodospirillaceae bacterium]|nr:adenosylcobalamin-dependent ribonucleoside-diphosphate reductase [Rhodospirillaceae bacterium]MBT5658563.1 adenosylcobalamin-dependent ribonucleoside-diphosphate reductase [Rhodospirillaceae bacterium]